MPFNLDEVHYSDAKFYNDFSSAGSEISHASRIPLPLWEVVLDLNDQEFLATAGKGKRIQPEANVLAYTPPQCSRVMLPNDRIVYHL